MELTNILMGSWSIKLVGKRDAVKKVVLGNPTAPQEVKNVILLMIGAGVPKPGAIADKNWQDGVRVETHGHYHEQDAWSSINKLEVELVKLEL